MPIGATNSDVETCKEQLRKPQVCTANKKGVQNQTIITEPQLKEMIWAFEKRFWLILTREFFARNTSSYQHAAKCVTFQSTKHNFLTTNFCF